MEEEYFWRSLPDHKRNMEILIKDVQENGLVSVRNDYFCFKANRFVKENWNRDFGVIELNTEVNGSLTEIKTLMNTYLNLSCLVRPKKNTEEYNDMVNQTAMEIKLSRLYYDDEVEQLRNMKSMDNSRKKTWSYKFTVVTADNAWFYKFTSDVISVLYDDESEQLLIRNKVFNKN